MAVAVAPDLVSEDRETSRLLVVEVQSSISDRDRDFFLRQLRSYAEALGKPKTVYYVLVDSDTIQFYEEASPPPRLLLSFSTAEVLKPYMGQSYTGEMSEFLLAGMTMAWLRDLGSHWREQNPPGSDHIAPDVIDLLTKAAVRVASPRP